MTRSVVGCMTGTSIDALDAALVHVDGTGLGIAARFVRGVSRPLGELKAGLRRLADQAPMPAGEIAALNRALSQFHAEVITELTAGEHVELVSVHGQTVFHAPPVSWQMINASIIAQATGVPVVSDLRQGDLAAGGQGAPLTPLSDWVMFRSKEEARAVVNLGGFCNATLLDPGTPPGFTGADLCVCNQLLDLVARRVMGVEFDDGGRHALTAEPDHDALDDLLGMLAAQSGSKRSLGTGDEAAAWIGRHWRGGAGCSGAVLAATACEAIAETIAGRTRDAQRLILAGGGVKNGALVKAITSAASCRVEASEKHGVPVEMREAMGWAVLGAMAVDGVALPLKHITGARANVRAGVLTTP